MPGIQCRTCGQMIESEFSANLYRCYAMHVLVFHPNELPPWVESVIDAEHYLYARHAEAGGLDKDTEKRVD